MPALNTRPVGTGATSVLGGGMPMAIYPVKARPRAVSTLAETATNSDPAVCRLIAAHPVLGTLPEHDWRPLLGWSRIRNVRRQEVICRQGDPVSAVILVLEGYVKLSTSIVDGDEIFLDIAGSGGCFGDLTTLQKQPHDANITALSLCRLLMIDARQFRCAFEHRPEGLLAIMRLASERLQIVALHLMENQVRTAPARLAKALLRLAGLSPPGSGRAADLPVQLTQSELGAMTGVCREVINRQLSAWRDLGWIQMSGGTVKSVDATALSTML